MERHKNLPPDICYRPCTTSQMWPSKSGHFRVRRGEKVGGWTRGWRVFWGWLGNLASPLNGGGAVIGREKRALLRHHLELGMHKAAIARHLGVSRRTVYNWIEAGELDRGADSKAVRYGPRAPRPSMLDPYKEHPAGGLSDAERRTVVQRGAGGGLSGRLRPSEALRTRGSAARAGGAVRPAPPAAPRAAAASTCSPVSDEARAARRSLARCPPPAAPPGPIGGTRCFVVSPMRSCNRILGLRPGAQMDISGSRYDNTPNLCVGHGH